MGKIVRNEKGQIVSKELSSEEASAMAKRKWEIEKDKSSEVEQILEEAGYLEPAEAPVVLRKLAEQIAQGGSRSVSAAREFVKQTTGGEKEKFASYDGEGPCPLCKRDDSVEKQLGIEGEQDLLRLLNEVLEMKEAGYNASGGA